MNDDSSRKQPEARDETDPERDEELDDEFEEGPPPTPFDHPLFLPILITGFAVWFAYDGWFNPEFAAEHVTWNRWAAGILGLGAVYFGLQAKKEIDEDRRSREKRES